MSLIARYIFGRYVVATAGFVALLALLGWMVQLLRSIDLITAKGQGMLTMLSQSLLVVPEVISIILFLCVALGISRTLQAMQTSKELFPIHSGAGVGNLFRSILVFVAVSVAFDVILTHQIVPIANQIAAKRSDEINADLIANSSKPGRFTEIATNLTLMIEGRAEDGTGLGFFLFDKRDPTRSQTTYAETSQLSKLDDTLFVKLTDGAIQYFTYETEEISTLEFGTYQVAVRELAQSNLFAAVEPTSIELIGLIGSDLGNQGHIALLHSRLSSALYVLCMAVFAFTMTMQPKTMRSKSWLSIDVIILGLGILIKVIGISAKQLAAAGGAPILLLYAVPFIVIFPAIVIASSNGSFSRMPKHLRGAIQ